MTEKPSDPLAPGDPIPIAPSLDREELSASSEPGILGWRTVQLSLVAAIVAAAATVTAKGLVLLIALVTNVSFFGRWSFSASSPAENRLGLWILIVPVIGGVVVGYMARYGSAAIRGHGIPEAMESILTNQSRVPPKLTLLKPTSSAIAIGTGGPFGAEGPIIATGGALGSLVGQLLKTSAFERKVLLSAGAAAGMTAIFGSPIAAVILAVELLLFELRASSIIPVACACAVAAATRAWFFPAGPVFAMPDLAQASFSAVVFYAVLGLVIGGASVGATRLVYWVEDLFERVPVHWMWYPAIGGLAVGLIGYFEPHTLGVGYDNITAILGGHLVGTAVLMLAVLKFVSWSLALGSGTSGGTLAPLFTIGGGLGAALGLWSAHLLPQAGIDPRLAALVGMAALFGGASRALLTSIVFAFETTQQPAALLPLLAGCAAAYLVSCLLMRSTIMTEKIARRGIRVPDEYVADYLNHVSVREVGLKPVVSLSSSQRVSEVRDWLAHHELAASHQGYPVLDESARLIGVLTRRDLLDPEADESEPVEALIGRPPVTIREEATLRDAADLMVRHGVGRLPIVDSGTGRSVIGIITRSDILGAHRTRLLEHEHRERTVRPFPKEKRVRAKDRSAVR